MKRRLDNVFVSILEIMAFHDIISSTHPLFIDFSIFSTFKPLSWIIEMQII